MRVYRSSYSLDQVIDTVSCTLGVERSEVLSRSRQRRLSLARALITWYATERGVATLAEVARRLERDPSTLFVGVERYRTLRPELFNLTALPDTGPLLRPTTPGVPTPGNVVTASVPMPGVMPAVDVPIVEERAHAAAPVAAPAPALSGAWVPRR